MRQWPHIQCHRRGFRRPDATVIQLTSGSSADENSLASPTHVFPVTNSIANAGTNFTAHTAGQFAFHSPAQPGGINSYTNLLLQFTSPISTRPVGCLHGLGTAVRQLDQSHGQYQSRHHLGVGNTNIAIVDSDGNVTGVGSGTTSIIAAYASLGLSATQSLQVVNVPTALVHRYSFNDGTANDSVGGANGTLMGNATVSGGQLVLPNATSAAPATDYLQLPAGILTNSVNGPNNDPAVTVEAWATFKAGQYTWANLFDFGNRDCSGLSEYDIHFDRYQLEQKRWRNLEIILVIHDDPRSKWTVRRILEPAGYSVITVDSGPIAVNVMRTIKPRLVVADIRLQGGSGEVLCRQIRAESKTVPLLVLSAIGDVADVVRLLELGADGYMAEPFSPIEFLARVRAAVRHFKT